LGNVNAGRQVLSDFGYSASQHQGRHQRFHSASACDILLEHTIEFFKFAEIPRNSKIHQRPQVTKAIFDWCARYRDTNLSPELLYRGSSLGLGVLNGLSFVQNDYSPFQHPKHSGVSYHSVIGCDYYVMIGEVPIVTGPGRTLMNVGME
jgi:hypothetical protein